MAPRCKVFIRLPFLHGFRLGLLAIVLVPVVSRAAIVTPGEWADFDDEPFQLPAGEKLAEKVVDFTLRFPVPDGFGSNPPSTATGALSSSVYRDTDSDGLIFLYKVEVVDAVDYTDETSDFVVGSFAGFTTDVRGRTTQFNSFGLRRSADGSTLRFRQSEGLGRPPTLLIETDATAFDDRGTASYLAGGDFDVFRGGDGYQTTLEATVSFSALYQPIIPEPASMAFLLAAAAAGLLRRRRA